jgi:hypothetical protein
MDMILVASASASPPRSRLDNVRGVR